MRYIEFMAEAIPNRPRNIRLYLTKRIAELGQMLDDLNEANQLIHDGAEGHNLLRDAIRYGIEDTPYHGNDTDVWTLEHVNLDREFQIARLKETMDSYLRFINERGYDFLRYVMSALDDAGKEQQRAPDYYEQFTRAFKMLPYAEAGFQTYGFTPGDPEHEADPEYVAAKKMLAGYRLKAKVFARIEPLEADLRVKLGVLQRMRAHDASLLGPEKFQPEHGEVETLYHATAFVPEILRDGFQAERPSERIGVGNFGHQQLISFTHDLEIARNIMRSFKEIWMIAHRQLSMPQIMNWARAEGIDDQVRKAWGHDVNNPMVRRDADPHDVVKVYRYWLTFSKLRENPMLVSPWEIVDVMQNRTLKDIGVLSCEVRLEQTDAYQFGEAEFRLPADRVQSVKQAL